MTETMETIDWGHVRNALRKRLKHHTHPNDLADAVQDGLAFVWTEIDRHDTDIGLAIWRAVDRVKKGQTYAWSLNKPIRQRWQRTEDPAYFQLCGTSQGTKVLSHGHATIEYLEPFTDRRCECCGHQLEDTTAFAVCDECLTIDD